MKTDASCWLVLVTSLPTANATERMRLWRALKGLGCGVLRDGVYLLPARDALETAFRELMAATRTAGGSAALLRVLAEDAAQAAEFVGLFNRTAEFAALVDELGRARSEVPSLAPADVRRRLRGLGRALDALAATDFFPGEPQAQARALLDVLQAEATARLSPGEPQAMAGQPLRRDRADYQGRVWATRARPWVDRLASAWLIRRHIDPDARFVWLERPEDVPAGALGFDFDGAEFSHLGARVTFETLLASFGLEGDAALARIGAVVHCLDVGGVPVAEAPGVEALLAGARARCADDDALLDVAGRIFGDLYLAWRQG